SLKVFKFRKEQDSLGEYSNAEFADIGSFSSAELKRLFEESFHTEFDQEQWRWKYEFGNGRCVVARSEPGGNIVSHYGGAPREILYFGQPNVAIQVCDVMVLPEIRRHYGKRSLFFKTAATFLEREIGNTVRQLLGFGFPNQKAMNIALRLGLYEKTDDFIELVYSVPEKPSSALQVELANLEDQQQSDAIDGLWQQMATAFGDAIIGIRDSSYLKYRYFQHPFYHRGLYHPYLVRDEAGHPSALFVLKAHGDELLLMDLISPAVDIKPMLGEIVAFCCKQWRRRALKIWITRAWQEAVQLPDCVVNDLGIEIPCNSWNRGPDAETLYGAWWLTAGDMDFM
ncbi:MAG: GNAT family N-acetyltransferase, partial [Pseudomonadales bacterium]|nr:GNAT family N-acetyltransferase [Pseudomonadales bacterium]